MRARHFTLKPVRETYAVMASCIVVKLSLRAITRVCSDSFKDSFDQRPCLGMVVVTEYDFSIGIYGG
jgi:hypothetical protein